MLADWFGFVVGHLGRILLDIIAVLFSPLIFIYYSMTRNNFHDKKVFKSVLITGGSAGIGKAIGMELMRVNNGKINIIITGRNTSRLEKARKEFETKLSSYNNNGTITTQEVDVCDKDGMKECILKMDAQFELDLVVANAGTHPFSLDVEHYFVTSKTILDTNCQGVLNTILPIIPKFQDRKQGHIACIGSLAGYIPNTMNSHYGASKAYVRFLCDDLRPKLKLVGNIDVTYIAPGYVITNMLTTDDAKKMPAVMSAEKAAQTIVHGLTWNHGTIMLPSLFANFVWAMGSLHPILLSLIVSRNTKREQAAPSIGFFHEFDPDDEFGGEC